MVAFKKKKKETQKNVPQNEEKKKKIVVFWQISQVNNKLPRDLFKRRSCAAKKKWLKVWKIQ